MRMMIFPTRFLSKMLGADKDGEMLRMAKKIVIGFSDVKGYSGEFFLQRVEEEDTGLFDPIAYMAPDYYMVLVGLSRKDISVHVLLKYKDGRVKKIISGKFAARDDDVSDAFLVQWARKVIQALSFVDFEQEMVMNLYKFVWQKYPEFHDMFKVV